MMLRVSLVAAMLAAGNAAAAETDSARSPTARTILRNVDCARCHGRDHEGLAAPSIVEYARTQSREMFLRAVLDGDPPRGMPGYRGNPRILENIDDIYRYFLERATGNTGRGPDSSER
jgi:mono/diheme cytochrome c family protein